MINKKFGAFSSSADSTKLALTWKGALLGLIPLVIAVASISGVELAQADLSQLIETIGTLVSASVMAVGIGRKILIAFKSKE